MFSSVFSVCCRISLPTNSPVWGSSATCPDIYRNPFARMPCEYGPMGFGPRSVTTTSLIVCSPSLFPHSLRPFLHTARETLPVLPAASSTFLQIPRRSGAFPLRTPQSNRSNRSLSPAGRITFSAWPFERFPARNGPATHRKTKSFSRSGRPDLPLSSFSRPFSPLEESGEAPAESFPCANPRPAQHHAPSPRQTRATLSGEDSAHKTQGSARIQASSPPAKAPRPQPELARPRLSPPPSCPARSFLPLCVHFLLDREVSLSAD